MKEEPINMQALGNKRRWNYINNKNLKAMENNSRDAWIITCCNTINVNIGVVRIPLFLILSFIIDLTFVSCTSSVSDNSLNLARTNELHVPEDFTVEMVAGPDLVEYPMFGTVDENGRLFLFESTGNVYEESEDAIKDPQFRINLLEDLDGDGIYDKSTIFADKVGFPQGGVFYKGSLYASSAPDLLKFTDTDGDGVADKREVLLSGWVLNVNANSLIGPFMSPDGWLYMTSAIMGFDVTTKEGERLKGETARIWRVRPDGSELEWISAGGMNNPVELTFTGAGEPIGTETYFTNPEAGQRDALVYFVEGGVYPKPNSNIDRDNLIRTGELMPVISKYSRVSPSGISRYRNSVLGEGFKDNLFSAQFNTHRIIRHKLLREGASFRTEDTVFLSSNNQDFHPTDVLEDADGSLLVVETGGWFIKGCPLSQVSKPELKGAIYRIRRNGVVKEEDPYGNQIQWESIPLELAAEYVQDTSPFISERAIQSLVDQGGKAVEVLTNLLLKSSSNDARTKAVFALYRIGTPEANSSVRLGLNDSSSEVRVAAARSVGLARDAQAVKKLFDIVQNDEPEVQRQAATALGQIGGIQDIPALLNAIDGIDDRFIKHAVIYSLISFNQPHLIYPGLTHASPQVREAALITLDQMQASTLQFKDIIPFLSSINKELQHTALWVASHHPEWSEDMIALLSSRFQGAPLTEDEAELFGEILISFCGDENIQKFISKQFDKASKENKLFLLNTISKCGIEKIPQAWVDLIGKQIVQENDPQIQSQALVLLRLRGISSLIEPLQRFAGNKKISAGLRIQAIGALLETQPKLTDEQFLYLYDMIQAEIEAPLRQQAASALEQGELSDEQLMKLAADYLPQIDAFLLPRLLPLFQGANNSTVGRALILALSNSPILDSFTEENVQTIFSGYPKEIMPAVDDLLSKLRNARAGRVKRLSALENLIEGGDIERGRTLYFDKAICWTCHKIGKEGGELGPDLTSIQRDRSTHDILEAIVYPSASFVREYETYRIKTKTNEYIGIIQQQTPTTIILGTSMQTSVRISRDEIVSTNLSEVSMMPQGLDKLLTDTEVADLMAFILGQDQDPKTDEAILR